MLTTSRWRSSRRTCKGTSSGSGSGCRRGVIFPPPVRAVEIPKKDGSSRSTRTLGVPTVADRIAQVVARSYLEPCVEPVFHEDSYGYRPGRSAHDALAVCRERCWQNSWVLEMDIRKFFPVALRSGCWIRGRSSRGLACLSCSSQLPGRHRLGRVDIACREDDANALDALEHSSKLATPCSSRHDDRATIPGCRSRIEPYTTHLCFAAQAGLMQGRGRQVGLTPQGWGMVLGGG